MSAVTETDLSPELRSSIARLARRLRQQRHDSGLGLGALSVLGTLDRHGPQTPGELAEREKVRPPSMSRTIARLESRGMIRRVPHPTDRRQYHAEITAPGKALLTTDRRRKDAWLSLRLGELTSEERSTLIEATALLDRLARA